MTLLPNAKKGETAYSCLKKDDYHKKTIPFLTLQEGIVLYS